MGLTFVEDGLIVEITANLNDKAFSLYVSIYAAHEFL